MSAHHSVEGYCPMGCGRTLALEGCRMSDVVSRTERSTSTTITVLWAIHDHYPKPHVVRAWSRSLQEVGYGLDDEINEAKEWMENWGDESGWRYWTTVEHVHEPAIPDREDEDAYV